MKATNFKNLLKSKINVMTPLNTRIGSNKKFKFKVDAYLRYSEQSCCMPGLNQGGLEVSWKIRGEI